MHCGFGTIFLDLQSNRFVIDLFESMLWISWIQINVGYSTFFEGTRPRRSRGRVPSKNMPCGGIPLQKLPWIPEMFELGEEISCGRGF